MGELLGALGLAWPRLLFYPGGLFAMGLAWLLVRPGATRSYASRDYQPAVLVIACVPPLAALSLLPLPYAVPFPYGLDLPVAMALLEWPRWLARRDNDEADLVGRYAPLILAGLALAQGAGSWRLDSLSNGVSNGTLAARVWLLLGSSGWLWGAWWAGRDLRGPGAGLRLAGHLLIAGLPWLTVSVEVLKRWSVGA